MADIVADTEVDAMDLIVQEQVIVKNRTFIVEHLDAEDIIDGLIQEHIIGRSAAQRIQMAKTSRGEKNRIICEQLTTAGPGVVEKFCKILRDNRRQIFIAERLEKSLYSATKQHSSGPLTVKSSQIDVERIKARYIRQPFTSKTDWPMHCVTQYVELALVDKEVITIRDENLNEITKLSLQGEVDKIFKKKNKLDSLKEIFHYQNQPCPRVIVIKGAPGIGKTTLANKICFEWARDGFLAEDFDHVLLIPLRSAQEQSVKEVMVKYIGGVEAYKELMMSAGEKCLVIFEGLDEISVERQKSDEVLVATLKECTLLEKATILITSRPHACEYVKPDRCIEIVGFGKREIQKFVRQSFRDVQTVEKFLVQLSDYPHICSLCYIPINLVMIVDIFEVKKKLPSTITEVYKLFIVMMITRQIKKANTPSCLSTEVPAATEEMLCKLLTGIPKVAVRTVFVLSRLAYCGFFSWYSNREKQLFCAKCKDPKIIFTIEDLSKCDVEVTADWDGYGLLKATPTHDLPVDITTYNFSHLTIQEFLSAVYLSLLSDQKQQHLLSEHFDDYPNVFIFLCGLTRLAPPAASQFVFEKLRSKSTCVLTALQCVYETGEIDQSRTIAPFELNLSHIALQQYDCLCVGHVLSWYPVLKVNMRECHIGDSDAEVLSKNYSGQLLQELILYDNDLTVNGVKHVINVVMKSSASLRVLSVGDNPIGDDGMALIIDYLYHNTTLNELSVHSCKLSAKGASCVGRYLKNCNLQVLDMGENFIGNDRISVMMDGLLHNKTLIELKVYKCGLSAKDASCIGEILKTNCTLKTLNINENPIGDDGISHLMKGLHQNTTLTTLHMRMCEVSVTGARCIGELLQVNTTLETIWMGLNNIEDDGITVIAGAFGKARIRVLGVYKCNITATGAKKLAAGLSVNQSIKKLLIDKNLITVEGAHLILQSAINNNVCEEVDMKYEYKADDEIQKMMDILETKQKAKRDSNSRFTDNGEDKGSS